MNCDNCGKQTRTVVPVMDNATRYRVLDDILDMNRPLPRSALTPEQDAAIPWGTHPDDDQFRSWCVDCAEGLQGQEFGTQE